MAIIYTYPVTTPAAGDLVLMSDVSTSKNATKSATVQSLIDLVPTYDLQTVLVAGNTAANSITLTGGTGNITISGNYTGTGRVSVTGVISTTTSIVAGSSLSVGTTLNVTGLSTLASVDINGGNIDGTVIGNGTPAAGTFTTLIGTTIDGAVGSVTPTTGAFTTITGSGNMAIDTDTLFVDAATDRVGIGTTTPNNTLELESSSGDIIIEMDNNVPNSANLKIKCGAGDERADLILDNNLHVTLRGQRVGIINTNPSHTLDVLGDGRVTSNFIIGGTTTITNELNLGTSTPGSAGQLLASAGAGAVPTWANVADIGIQVQTTPIPTGEVAVLNSSPVVILAAPAAGVVRMPISFIIDWVVGTGAPSTNTDISIYQINNTEQIGTCAGLLATSGNSKIVIPISQPGVPVRCTVGEATATTIQVDSGDPNMTGSNSSMTVYALYRDITL